MGLLFRRCFCWKLRTATFVNFITITILSFGALLLRLLDLGAYETNFEISQGFRWNWKSHQYEAFLASDIIVNVCHLIIILFTLYMIYVVTMSHFVLYMETMRAYTYTFIMYTFIEFCFSVFEFSFYGLNTFRLAFVVFIWLYWLARTIAHIGFTVILFSRIEEMENEMAYELRFSDKKYVHSYSVLG
ncbi:uncharacterized protein LOC101846247 isoform X2 [Aplysia californica]|uniref:Uncharacterized protein LOC101846247 isoform X2 n=1 Tax=Aplysia californica TaxID=6500 RepID=A0ABM0K482_APLCA|nr:uncharacterized protein LOC101846247 isoform X2 [Aplysia californica]